jgi:uncharacterized protein (TIGR00369 family)
MTTRTPPAGSGLPDDPDAMLRLGRELLAAQPFSVLLGTTLDEFNPGHATLSLPLTDQLLQQHGYTHGGVVSYLADNALTFAGGSVLGPAVVTAEYKINYLRPARGDRLRAIAEVVNAGQRLAVVRCTIIADAAGVASGCAVAQGTIATINGPSPSTGSPSE